MNPILEQLGIIGIIPVVVIENEANDEKRRLRNCMGQEIRDRERKDDDAEYHRA